MPAQSPFALRAWSVRWTSRAYQSADTPVAPPATVMRTHAGNRHGLPVSCQRSGERTKNAPWGLQGGGAAKANRAGVRYSDGSYVSRPKETRIEVPKGAVVELSTGGGGGYGPPSQRSVAAIQADLRAGYISEEYARRHYPHAMNPGDSSKVWVARLIAFARKNQELSVAVGVLGILIAIAVFGPLLRRPGPKSLAKCPTE